MCCANSRKWSRSPSPYLGTMVEAEDLVISAVSFRCGSAWGAVILPRPRPTTCGVLARRGSPADGTKKQRLPATHETGGVVKARNAIWRVMLIRARSTSLAEDMVAIKSAVGHTVSGGIHGRHRGRYPSLCSRSL
jgi:hypothetical protein